MPLAPPVTSAVLFTIVSVTLPPAGRRTAPSGPPVLRRLFWPAVASPAPLHPRHEVVRVAELERAGVVEELDLLGREPRARRAQVVLELRGRARAEDDRGHGRTAQ